MGRVIVWFVGNTRPSLLYTVKAGGQPVNLTDAGFTRAVWSMRDADSAIPKVDEALATILDDGTVATRGQIRYDPQLTDVDTPGEYRGWFTLFAGTDSQDTPELEVRVKAHLPGSTILTVQDLFQNLRITGRAKRPTADEVELAERMIARATTRVENAIGHRFALEAATTKLFGYHGGGLVDLAPFDLRAAPTLVALDTDLSAGGVALDSWGWRLEPRTSPHGIYTHIVIALGAPGRYLSSWWSEDRPQATILGRQLSITGDWGWASIPDDLQGAILEVATAMWSAPSGDPRSATPEWTEWPSGVESILEHYKRPRL